jgi:hypothetical protein
MSPKLKSITGFKCPRCLKGDFFVSHPYKIKTSGFTLENCSHCGEKFLKEPGYFYGAMYVSYAFAVMLFCTVYVSYLLWFPEVSVWWPIGIIGVASFILAPFFNALSKIVWINFFVKFDPKKA